MSLYTCTCTVCDTSTNTYICSCLWFFLEPLILKCDNYEFLRKMFETIKQTVDAEEPNNMEINKVSI